MNMPGFNAEASLYKTSQSYHVAGSLDLPARTVQPAFGGPRLSCVQICEGDSECVACCKCRRAGGGSRCLHLCI
jgi:hypothetical protein